MFQCFLQLIKWYTSSDDRHQSTDTFKYIFDYACVYRMQIGGIFVFFLYISNEGILNM